MPLELNLSREAGAGIITQVLFKNMGMERIPQKRECREKGGPMTHSRDTLVLTGRTEEKDLGGS